MRGAAAETPRSMSSSQGGTSDAALIARALAGDSSAFEGIVVRYADDLFRVAHRYTGNREDAEDAASEALCRAYDRMHEISGVSSIGPWLRTIVVNLCLDGYRKGRYRRRRVEDYARQVPTVSVEPDPVLSAADVEVQVELEKALRQLSPRQRSAFVLFEMRGLDIAEVAQEMGCSQGTVKAQLHRARKRLRDLMGRFLEDRSDAT